MAVFAGEGLLDAPIHEIGDMGIFLGLGGAELAQTVVGDHLTKQAIKGLGREGHGHRKALLVLGKGDQVQRLDAAPLESLKRLQHQGAHELTHPVGAEVEAHQPIARADQPRCQTHRLEEFIGDPGRVGGLKNLGGRKTAERTLLRKEEIGLLGAIPTVVAVHGPVAAAEAGDPADTGLGNLPLDRGQKSRSAIGGGVAAVGHHMDTDVGETPACGPAQQPA